MAATPKPTPKVNHWHEEIASRLHGLRLYEEFRRRGPSDGYFNHLDSTLVEAIYYAHQRAKVIVETLPEYTLHDSDHLFRVAELMGKLISDEQLRRLSIVDLYLLLLCAFFHDLGLAPKKREVDAWRNALHHDFVPKHSEATSISNFISSRPEQRQLLRNLSKLEDDAAVVRLENKLISQFIRETHGARLTEIIGDDWKDRFHYRDKDLTPYVTIICQSHVEDALKLSTLERIVPCADKVAFCPPFIGVILRLADLLDFDAKRAPTALFDAMGVEDGVSLLEWNKHRSVSAWTITPKHLQIAADCAHPIIEVAIRDFCEVLNGELLKCSSVTSTLSDPVIPVPKCYTAQFPPEVDTTRIGPKKLHSGAPLYTFSKTRFTLDQEKVVDLLMGTSLYGNPTVALRELLQNSIDACLVRSAFEKAWGRSYEPSISIHFDRTNARHTLTVTDNGIGMDSEIVHEFYAKVGSCYYKSAKFFRLLAENRVSFTSISRFGIGVLSYFLVANRVLVSTRRLIAVNSLCNAILVKVDGVNGLFWISDGVAADAGTETTLDLMPDHPWKKRSAHDIADELRKLLPEPPFTLQINVDGELVDLAGGEKLTALKPGEAMTYTSAKAKVRTEQIQVSDRKNGYQLDAVVGWLERNRSPTSKFVTVSTKVQIKGQIKEFAISNSIESRQNRITRWSSSFDYDDGAYRTNDSYFDFLESDVRLSLHGFHVPFDPFTEQKDSVRLTCRLDLPFFIHGLIAVRAPSDLNLNAARDNVIPDNKWFELRNWTVRAILKSLEGSLQKNYYIELLNLWKQNTDDQWIRQIIDNYKNV